MVIRAVKSALQETKEAFDRVCRDANPTLVPTVLFRFVVHLVVLARMDCTVQDSAAIGHNSRTVFDVVVEDRAQCISCYAIDVIRADFAAHAEPSSPRLACYQLPKECPGVDPPTTL